MKPVEPKNPEGCDELYQTHKDMLPKALYMNSVLYY